MCRYFSGKDRAYYNEITRDACQKWFEYENQICLFPTERPWIGDSWLANLYLTYINDYVRFESFVSSEVEQSLINEIGGDGEELDYCEDRVADLFALFANMAKFNPDATHEQIGLDLEKLMFKDTHHGNQKEL
jgi:hypothetical protein